MSCPTPVPDLDCVRTLVRQSRFAVGLVSLRDGVFVELSPAAATVTGLGDAHGRPVDIEVIADDEDLVVSLRVVARDEHQPYAIALFSTPPGAEAPAEQTTIETLLGPLRELNEPRTNPAGERWDRLTPESVPGLEDLTDRQQEILTRLMHGDRVTTMSRGMHLSASTIRNHLSALYRKVGVHSQAELIEHLHAVTR